MEQSVALEPGFLNHITDEELRRSLASDHREIQAALAQGCWKSVLVLGGSMVEAVLVDYLLSSMEDDEDEDAILSQTLGQVIDRCKPRGILTDKTSQLCVVVKNYRNLIHPGRVKRKAETVTEEDARVTAALVKMVADDVSRKRQETYGYTAEQIVAKVLGDPVAFPAILPSMLKRLNNRERRRLVFDLLPQENLRLRSVDAEKQDQVLLWCIKACYRIVLREDETGLGHDLTTRYADLLHKASLVERFYYESSFLGSYIFRCATPEETEVIKPHLLSILERGTTSEILNATPGIGQWFTVADVNDDDWSVSRLVRIYQARHKATDTDVWIWFNHFFASMPDEVYEVTMQELTRIGNSMSRNHPERAEAYLKIAGISRIPF